MPIFRKTIRSSARERTRRIDRDNFLLYPKRAITSAIKSLDARVKEVDIVLIDRRRLVATVSEYAPALLWCPPERISATTTVTTGCYFADHEGHIFAPAPEYSGNPFLTFATTYPAVSEHSFLADLSILPTDEFLKTSAFLRRLAEIGLMPRIVEEVAPHDFVIVTDRPWTIRWSSAGDPETDAENLTLVLEHLPKDGTEPEAVESIDLRFGNKVFYR